MKEERFNAVKESWKAFESYLIETRYSVRLPKDGTPIERSWHDIANRIKREINAYYADNKKVNTLSKQIEPFIAPFAKALEEKYIIPASPVLMTFGNPHTKRKGYFSCYPLGYVEDTFESIYATCNNMREIYIRGGGVGLDLSKLRAKNSPVDNHQGIASGPVGFLPLFDAVTGTTNQGGRRRGALLIQMHYTHPDIKAFIKAKSAVPAISQVVYSLPEDERIDIPLQNMNISVVVDEHFFKTETGKELLDLIATQAWKSGDPGLLFIDNMKTFSPFNPEEYGEEHIPAFSNPCGEYLAPSHTACNLITVNVAKIARDCFDPSSKTFDFNAFFKKVSYYAEIATYFANHLIFRDEGYPLEEIRKKTQEVRPVGVGMTGFHTALLLAYYGTSIYGDDTAINFAQKTQASLTIGTLKASSELAIKTGTVYKWNKEYLNLHLTELEEIVSKLPLQEEFSLVKETAKLYGGFFNSITTSQPPTGSVSQFAYVGGDTGIEPMFAIELTRRVRDFYSNQWKTVNLTTLYIADLLEDDEFRKRVESQIAHNISPIAQLKMCEAFQKFIHTGISKTVNVPRNTSVEEIKDLIFKSKEMRLKGFTVFRDGCREDTVYVTSPKETKDVSTVNASLSPSSSHSSATSGSTSTEAKKIDDRAKDSDSKVKDLPPIRHGYIHEVRGPVNAYIIISKDEEERIREVFISVGKAGTTLNGMFQGLGRVMSVALRKHPDLIEEFIHTLRGIETG
ncbi:MAG: hypothetical protein QXM53_02480, partial [Thermofilaceae archaeon]